MTEERYLDVIKRVSIKNNFINLQHLIFIGIIACLFILYKIDYYLFHSSAEIYSCVIAGAILCISLNTYQITRNNYFLFLGIGYMFILILDLFHTITYGDLLIYHKIFDTDTRLWVVARGMELATILLSFVPLYKPNKKINFFLVFIAYFAITLILVIDVYKYNVLIPTMRLKGIGITQIKMNFEYFAAGGFILCCFILHGAKEKIDRNLFKLLEISLFCKVISELCFTKYFSIYDIYNMLGHIFKVISYYLIYLGIVVNGLQRPFDMININLDIERKQKEKERRYMEEVIYNNEQCYDWLIENSSSGIIITRNKQISYANSTAIKMLGANNINDIVGTDIKKYLFDSSINSEELFKEFNSKKFNEIKLLKINKEVIHAEYSVNRITYRSYPAHFILLKDIKLKKEINDLKSNLIENEIELNKTQEYNKVLTEFFSNISHDLKTPINVILSAVQLLHIKEKQYNSDDFIIQLNRMLGIIKQNCFRLIRLVSNLIDISKFDSGFYRLILKNYNIVSVVEDITLSVGDYIKSKGINIIFDTDVEEKIMAVDADKIERIILNLLSNAVKFTNKGDEILVNIEDGYDNVKISVKDTGVGMPEDKLKMIFNRFSQVDDTLIRNKEGSGIGLSLVKSLAEMHHGKVTVNSKLGEGSEFVVVIPVVLVEEQNEEHLETISDENKIEKVLIEFSDIYGIE